VSAASELQADVISALNEIEDPELGVGIVDLGLVYGAQWGASGIEVEFTTTSPTCPFGDTLLAQIDTVLRQRFREASAIHVRRVHQPAWTPERLTDAARQKLGWTPTDTRGRSRPATGKCVWKN
jgi:metal-sulfur cluster biosynthetic enzyme